MIPQILTTHFYKAITLVLFCLFLFSAILNSNLFSGNVQVFAADDYTCAGSGVNTDEVGISNRSGTQPIQVCTKNSTGALVLPNGPFGLPLSSGCDPSGYLYPTGTTLGQYKCLDSTQAASVGAKIKSTPTPTPADKPAAEPPLKVKAGITCDPQKTYFNGKPVYLCVENSTGKLVDYNGGECASGFVTDGGSVPTCMTEEDKKSVKTTAPTASGKGGDGCEKVGTIGGKDVTQCKDAAGKTKDPVCSNTPLKDKNDQGYFTLNGTKIICLTKAEGDQVTKQIADSKAKKDAKKDEDSLFKIVFDFIAYAFICIFYLAGWVLTLILWQVFVVASHILSINPFSNPWYPLLLKLWGVFFGIAVIAILGTLMFEGFKRFLNFDGKSNSNFQDVITKIVVLLMTINFTFFGIVSAFGVAQGVGKIIMYSTTSQLQCNAKSKTDFSGGDQKAYLAVFKCVANSVGSISALRPSLDVSSGSYDNGADIVECVDKGACANKVIAEKIGDKTGRTIAVLFSEILFVVAIFALIWNFIGFAFKAVTRIIRLGILTVTSPLILTGLLAGIPQLKQYGDDNLAELQGHLLYFPFIAVYLSCFGIAASVLKSGFDLAGSTVASNGLGGGLVAYAAFDGGSVVNALTAPLVQFMILLGLAILLNQDKGFSAGAGFAGNVFKGVGLAATGGAGLALGGAKLMGGKALGGAVGKMAGNQTIKSVVGGIAAKGAVAAVKGKVGAVALPVLAAVGAVAATARGFRSSLKNKGATLKNRLKNRFVPLDAKSGETPAAATLPAPDSTKLSEQVDTVTGVTPAVAISGDASKAINGLKKAIKRQTKDLKKPLDGLLKTSKHSVKRLSQMDRNARLGKNKVSFSDESLKAMANGMGSTVTGTKKMFQNKDLANAVFDGIATGRLVVGPKAKKNIMAEGAKMGMVAQGAQVLGKAANALGVTNPVTGKSVGAPANTAQIPLSNGRPKVDSKQQAPQATQPVTKPAQAQQQQPNMSTRKMTPEESKPRSSDIEVTASRVAERAGTYSSNTTSPVIELGTKSMKELAKETGEQTVDLQMKNNQPDMAKSYSGATAQQFQSTPQLQPSPIPLQPTAAPTVSNDAAAGIMAALQDKTPSTAPVTIVQNTYNSKKIETTNSSSITSATTNTNNTHTSIPQAAPIQVTNNISNFSRKEQSTSNQQATNTVKDFSRPESPQVAQSARPLSPSPSSHLRK